MNTDPEWQDFTLDNIWMYTKYVIWQDYYSFNFLNNSSYLGNKKVATCLSKFISDTMAAQILHIASFFL